MIIPSMKTRQRFLECVICCAVAFVIQGLQALWFYREEWERTQDCKAHAPLGARAATGSNRMLSGVVNRMREIKI